MAADDYIDSTENSFLNNFDAKQLTQMVEEWITEDQFKRYELSLREGVEDYIDGRYFSAISIFLSAH
jgi:hypothetical protein